MALVQKVRAGITAGTGTATLNGVSASNTLVFMAITENSGGSVFSATPTGYTVANAPAAFTSSGLTVQGGIWFKQSPSAGTNSVTINLTVGNGGYCELTEWDDFVASPLDVAPAASNINAGVSTSLANSISSGTLSQANERLFAVYCENTSGAGGPTGLSVPATGFTDISSGNDSSADFVYEFCYKDVNSTAGATASWTGTDTTTIASQAIMAGFKLAASNTFSLTGNTSTSSEGTVARAVSYSPTAQTATFSEGVQTRNITYGLTGQTATFSEGTISASSGGNVTLSLSGQSVTFSEGTIGLNLGYSLNDGVPLTGQTANFTEGTPTNSVTYGLTGQTVTLTEGTITSQVGGNVTLSLTGQTVTLTEGTITTLSGYSLTGQTGTLSEGTIANGGLVIALTGQTIQGISGTVTQSGGTSLGAPPMYMAGFVSNISTFMAHNQT